ncbi:MAG: hypothetical protein AAFV93_20945, partial [Chloroflexota bacterium]
MPQSSQPVTIKVAKKRQRWFSTTRIAGILGFVFITILIILALFAPQISPYDPTERVARPFLRPNAEHLLGTNDIGYDILSELIYGTRVSLLVGFSAGFITVMIGTTVGILSGYYARLGALLMRMTDVILILPFLPLLIILAAYLGRSLLNTV